MQLREDKNLKLKKKIKKKNLKLGRENKMEN